MGIDEPVHQIVARTSLCYELNNDAARLLICPVQSVPVPELQLTPLLDLTPLDEEESDRPPERLEPDFTQPIPRPSVGATGTWGAGATGEWEGPEQVRIRTAADLFAARIEGEKAQREAESLGEQYRSIERFTPAGILNQPERIARAIAAPDAPEIPERFQPGQPIFPIPEPTGTSAMAGLGQLGVQTLNSLQTPEMIVTAPAAINPVGRALFAADMGRHIPEQVEQGAQVIGDIESTPAQKVVAGGTPVIAGTMTALLGKSEIPRPVETLIIKTEAAAPGALIKAKAALADTAKREPISDQVQQLETTIEKGIPDEIEQFRSETDIVRPNKRVEGEALGALPPATRQTPSRAGTAMGEGGSGAGAVDAVAVGGPLSQGAVPGSAKPGEIRKATTEGGTGAQGPKELLKSDAPGTALPLTLPEAQQLADAAIAMPGGEADIRTSLSELRKEIAAIEPPVAGADTATRLAYLDRKARLANRVQILDEALQEVAKRKPKSEKTIPAATEAPAPAAANQNPIPEGQAPVVEPGVGAVPGGVSVAETKPAGWSDERWAIFQKQRTAAVDANTQRMAELEKVNVPGTKTEAVAEGATPNSDWQTTARGRDVYKADIPLENSKEESVVKAITSAPSYPKLLAAYHRFQRSLYGKSYVPSIIEKTPWEMLDASSGVMSAGSQMAKTLKALESAVFSETGLPRKKPSSRFRGGTGVDWETVKPVEPLPEPAGARAKAGVEPAPAVLRPVRAENAQTETAASAAKAQPELPGVEPETQGAIATMGPPLMPTPPAGAPATPVKPISQIIRDLAKGLDLPIRFGRLTTSKYGGYFKKNPNLIGAKLANDMPIVAHEVGHKLDTIYPFTRDASIFPELEALGDPAIAGSRSSWTPSKSGVYRRGEGLAEFVRHWLTDPAQAQKLAPNTHTLFERVLAANEDLSATMRQAQSDIQLWKNAPQEARLDSSISRSDPNKSRYRLPNLMRDLVDDLHFLRMAVDDAKVSGPLPPSQNPYQLARTLRGSFGMADTFVTKGIVDFKTKEVRLGTDLESAMKPVSGRIDEFRRWIVSKQAQEMRSQGKETGLNPADVDFVANKYNADPAFNEAFTKVKAWNDGLLQYQIDAGLISPEAGTYMRAMNQEFVPFHRLFEVGAGESSAVAGGGSGRGLNAGKPGSLMSRKGSQRDIVDPLETMVKNAYTMITAAEKNAINTAVADLAPKSDMGRWVERVAAPKEMVKVELERIRKQLEDAGADLTGVPDDLLMSFFKPSGRAPFGENIIKVNRAGKQEFYRLDKELFDTFNALDQDASSRLLKLMSTPAQLLRAGVTLTPDFALSNAFRDTIGAAVLSKYTTYPFQATVRGIGAMLNDPKLVSEWAASGGKQSVEANYFDRAKLQKFLTEKITKDLTPAEQAMVVAKSPLTALRMITGTLEEATRIGEYKAALKKLSDEGMPIGDARRQAAFEARDLQDFAKGGAQTKIVRSLAAFWNAGLQGNVRLAQSFKQRPFQTTLKGLAFITLPKLLEQALNWNDEDYWDRPQWERDLFFMIPRGKDENGHTQFIRLPTPFEMGVIFGTVPGRILQAIREKTPKSLESLPGVMLRQSAPNPTPQSVLTLLEVNAGKSGYSFFRDRPIVPSSLQNAPPELQFTSQNSLTAKKVGRLLGVSPAKVDYAIAGLTGGVGKQLTHQVSDRAISAVTGEERTAQSTMPGARFVATPAGVQSESVDRFYKALEEANADAARVKAGETSQGQAKRAPRLNVVARRITDLRKQAREEQNPQARQRINLRIAEIAKQAITP